MKRYDPFEYLAGIAYPGRGILMGVSACGCYATMAYFIMGRSENSRNRVFSIRDSGIVTEAADPAKLTDPSLIIYAPVRVLDGRTTIVTNGDQTDTIYTALENGQRFEDALRTRTFEPDAPNFTPRISAVLHTEGGKASYRMSILKSADAAGTAPVRAFYEYDAPLAGEGRLLHTYDGNGDPLPSFSGEPVRVALPGTQIDALASGLWNALDMQNRVSLFVRMVHLASGETQTRILNQRG